MPDNKTVTLVRHDGTLMDATPEQAGRLALLGYKEVTPEQNIARLTQEARTDYYTSPGEQALAAGEGLASGLSFGATDYFGDDEVKARAQYNPGTRMATEALGALLPAFLTGGESAGVTLARGAEEAGLAKKIASVAPTNLLTDAAHMLAPEQTLTGALTRGAIEGAVYGGAGAADHAYLDGDPVTADAVLHGIGWGALIGGALGGVGEAISKGGEAAQVASEAEVRANTPVPKGALNKTAGVEYGAMRDEVANLANNMKEATALADAAHKEVTSALKAAPEFEGKLRNFNNIEVKELQDLYEKAAKTASAGRASELNDAIAEYSTKANDIAKRLGVEVPDPSKALMDISVMRKAADIAAKMPKDVEAFAAMGAKRVEDMVAALEKAQEMPFNSGLKQAIANFNEAMGLDPSVAGATDGGLRATQKSARALLKSEGKTPPKAEAPEKGKPGIVRELLSYAAGGKAYVAAKAAGVGRGGAYMAYRAVKNAVLHGGEEMVGMKAAALTRIRDAAAAWGPGLGKTISKAVPRVTALEYTLMGQEDKGTKDAQALAKKRADEIYNFAPHAADTIYRAVEPIAATQPMLAPMIHKNALAAFQALQAMAPKDPGAVSKLQSLWQPSLIQAQQLNKQLAVFHDPVGEIEQMLRSGQLDMDKITALQKISPPLWQEMRGALLNRLSEPGIMDKMSYRDQIYMSLALDLPLHSSMQPGFIATSQQIFQDRNQPLKANPRMGPGGGLPNPKDNNYATESQKSTER